MFKRLEITMSTDYKTMVSVEKDREKKDLLYHIINNNERKIKPKSYAANFSYDRKESWTH